MEREERLRDIYKETRSRGDSRETEGGINIQRRAEGVRLGFGRVKKLKSLRDLKGENGRDKERE